MPDDSESKSVGRASKLRRFVGIGIAALILAAVIMAAGLYLRGQVRQRLIERDAEILDSVTQVLYEQFTGVPEKSGGQRDRAGEIAAEMRVLLRASELRGVIAARLFSANGEQVKTVPMVGVAGGRISREELQRLKGLDPVAEYHASTEVGDFFTGKHVTEKSTVPVLKVLLPLHREEGEKLLGVAELIFAADGLNEDLASLDRSLAVYGGIVFLLGVAVLTVVITKPFRT